MCRQLVERKSYFDFLKILSIFLVLFIHTAAFRYPFEHTVTLKNHLFCFFSLLFSSFSKTAVPIFLMISGALLLARDEPFSVVLKRRVARFVLVIFLFQLIQHFFLIAVGKWEFSVSDFFHHCLSGHIPYVPVTWFLYAYLAFLLMLPFLRILVRHMENRWFYYLFILYLVFVAFTPGTNAISDYLVLCNGNQGQPLLLYLLAGYFFENRYDISSLRRRHCVLLLILSVSSIVMGAGVAEYVRVEQGGSAYSGEVPAVYGCCFLPSVTLFLLIKKCFQRFGFLGKASSLLCFLSGGVFFVMLVENVLRICVRSALDSVLSPGYPYHLLTACIACLLGCAVGGVMKKIPFLKEVL